MKIAFDEIERLGQEAVVTYFNTQCRNFPGEAEESRKNSQSGTVSWTIFEPSTPWLPLARYCQLYKYRTL
jgi:hypothetical protein